MNKKKLLITGSTFPRWKGDTEPRFILDYAKAMAKYYDVTVLVPAAVGASSKEILEGIPVIRYHYFPIHELETLCYPGAIVPRIREKKTRVLLVPFLFLAQFVATRKQCKKVDIVHVHWLIPQGIVQCFINKPYIITGHGGDVMSLNKGLFKFLKVRCLKRARAVAVVSGPLKKKIREIVPNLNAHVISMGCNTKLFGPDKRREQFFHQGEDKVILFVGRLAEKKGVPYLIEAMRKVERAVLVIVGKGDMEQELKLLASDMQDKVQFWGPKTHEELANIYASADVFVAPSITARDGDTEGLPTAIIEAMASGLPVISTRSGGIEDLIKHNENGLLVDEKDSDKISEYINSLIRDTVLSERLSAAAIQTAQEYDYDNIAYRYRELIESSEVFR